MDLSTSRADVVSIEEELGGDLATPEPSLLDDVVAEILAPPARREPVEIPVPSRPGYSLRMAVELDELTRKSVAAKQVEIDRLLNAPNPNAERILAKTRDLEALIVAVATEAILREGEVLPASTFGGGSEPLTFRHRPLLDRMGVKSASAAVVAFLGDAALDRVSTVWAQRSDEWPEGRRDPRS